MPRRSSGRPRILAIDDAPIVLDTLRLLFEPGSVETASSAEEALRALEADESLEILIVDLSLPGGGIPLLRTLRSRFPERIVIVLSGDASALAGAAGEKLGIFRTLEKGSASIDTLEQTIEEATRRLEAKSRG